jgi:hypothetical protein
MHLPTLVFLLARPLLPTVPGNFFAQCGLMVMSVHADSLLLHHALQRMLMFAGQNQTSLLADVLIVIMHPVGTGAAGGQISFCVSNAPYAPHLCCNALKYTPC